MNIYPLFSSSKGNMFCIESDSTSILIDVGVTYKNILLALEGINKNIKDISGILITHEHSDHIKGLLQICKNNDNLSDEVMIIGRNNFDINGVIDKYFEIYNLGNISYKNNPDLKIFTTEKTKLYIQEMLCEKNILANIIGLNYGDVFNIEDLEIKVLETSHDASMPCAYNIKNSSSTLTFATDLGYVSDEIQESLNNSNCNILESNFDRIMLEYGKYPANVKNRIRGLHGHLSNDDTAKAILTTLNINPNAKFILSHLSENNNTEALAKDTIFTYLKENSYDSPNISFASQNLYFERYEI